MAVPKMSQLHPGVGVNMVLKADQRSGKLTAGTISEILTRGDHPKGIKVRLSNGQIGRVQSLSTSSILPIAPGIARATFLYGINSAPFADLPPHSARAEGEGWRERYTLQGDYRQDPTPCESRSLADYIRAPVSSKRASAHENPVPDDTVQARSERDFPNLDTALIAAILADHDEPEYAREILSSLS